MLTRRRLLVAGGATGVVAWTAPTVIAAPAVAAASGSCPGGVTTCTFSSGLEGWTIDNSFGPGVNGLWGHSSARDGGALHYGRGLPPNNYATGGSRNSGAVTSPTIDLPTTGAMSVTFTIFRHVENYGPNNNYDVTRFSVLGTTNQVLWSAGSDGGTSSFVPVTRTIPATFQGQSVTFRFDFDTVDGLFNNFEGIYVGWFSVTGCEPGTAPGLAVPSLLRSATTAPEFPPPHPPAPR